MMGAASTLIHPWRLRPQGMAGLQDRLAGRQAERFGVGPAVVLGEHFADGAWPVCDGAVANLAARDWKTGNGHREPAGIRISHHLHNAIRAGVTLRGAARLQHGYAVSAHGETQDRSSRSGRRRYFIISRTDARASRVS